MSTSEIQVVFPAGMFGASGADSMLDKMLREIAVAACDPNGDSFPMGTPQANAAKYGVMHENDVFLLRPDYMDVECDCGRDGLLEAWHEANLHANDCYFYVSKAKLEAWRTANPLAGYDEWNEAEGAILRELCAEKGIPWNDGWSCLHRCSCGKFELCYAWLAANPHRERCPVDLPNFWFKPTNFRVSWYKYIGREVEINRPIELPELLRILEQCKASI